MVRREAVRRQCGNNHHCCFGKASRDVGFEVDEREQTDYVKLGQKGDRYMLPTHLNALSEQGCQYIYTL